MDDMKETEPAVLNELIEPSSAIVAADDIVVRTRKALPASRVALLAPMVGLVFFSAACLDLSADTTSQPAPVVGEAPKQPAGVQIVETKTSTLRATERPGVTTPERVPTLTPYEMELLEKMTPEQRVIWEQSKKTAQADAKQQEENKKAFERARQETEQEAKEYEAEFIKDIEGRKIAPDSPGGVPKMVVEIGKTVGISAGAILAVIGSLVAVIAIPVFLMNLVIRVIRFFGKGRRGGGGGQGPRYGGGS